MIRVLLSEKGDTPTQPWWWQFLRSTNQGSRALSTDERIAIINSELINWSAQIWQHQTIGASAAQYDAYIDFYDEQAYTWFVLRWS